MLPRNEVHRKLFTLARHLGSWLAARWRPIHPAVKCNLLTACQPASYADGDRPSPELYPLLCSFSLPLVLQVSKLAWAFRCFSPVSYFLTPDFRLSPVLGLKVPRRQCQAASPLSPPPFIASDGDLPPLHFCRAAAIHPLLTPPLARSNVSQGCT